MSSKRVVFLGIFLLLCIVPITYLATESLFWIVLEDIPELNLTHNKLVPAQGTLNPAHRTKILILTEKEKNLLLAGTATLLENEITKGADRTAKSIGIIDAPLTLLKAILADYDAYLQIFKEDLRETKLLATLPDGNQVVAFRVFDHAPKKKYYTNLITMTPTGMSWRLAQLADVASQKSLANYPEIEASIKRSLDDFQINQGSWYFLERFNDGDKTLAIYTINLRLAGKIMGSSLATGILNSLSRDNMPNVISNIAQEAGNRKAKPAAQ